MRYLLTFALSLGLLASPMTQAEMTVDIVAPSSSGGAAPLGIGMQAGIASYFAKVNVKGAINENSLALITYDDQYSPLQAAEHTRKLVGDESMLAAIGNVC